MNFLPIPTESIVVDFVRLNSIFSTRVVVGATDTDY